MSRPGDGADHLTKTAPGAIRRLLICGLVESITSETYMSNFYSEHNPAFRAPITDVVARFGLRLKRQGRELVGPCPVCGGNDRFAVHPTKGLWNCRHCVRGGDAIALLRHVEGCSFKEAVAALGGVDSGRGRRAPLSAANDDRTLGVAVRIWDQAVALGPEAIAYFERRDIDINAVPEHGGLRFHPACPWEGSTRPCVVGRYTAAIGNEQRGLWRRPIDGGKPKALGPTAGCVIRLLPDDAVDVGLVLGEGVETSLAAATRIEHRDTLLQPALGGWFRRKHGEIPSARRDRGADVTR